MPLPISSRRARAPIVGLLFFLLLGLSPAFAAPPARDVTIAALNGPTAIGMLKLMADAPVVGSVHTRFEIVSTPDLMVARLLSGSAQVGFLPLNLAANLSAKGVPIELAATTGDGVLYVVTSLDGIKSIADLRGKRLYNSERGSTPEFVLDFVLEHEGLNPQRDLTVDYSYNHIELAQEAAAGRVDLAVLPEPFAAMAIARNPRLHIVIDLQREWGAVTGTNTAYPTTAMVITRSLGTNEPSVVEALLQAEKASIAWANSHPAEAGVLAQRYVGLPAQVVAAAMPRLNLRYVPAAAAKSAVVRFLTELDSFDPASIGGRLPDSGFYWSP